MSLREQQSLFMRLLPLLLLFAYSQDYELTLGDGYRDPRCPYGAEKSNHKKRLAIDLNLFKDGEYLTETAEHRPLGVFWESLHPWCRWGGNYDDGNHYELVPNWRN